MTDKDCLFSVVTDQRYSLQNADNIVREQLELAAMTQRNGGPVDQSASHVMGTDPELDVVALQYCSLQNSDNRMNEQLHVDQMNTAFSSERNDGGLHQSTHPMVEMHSELDVLAQQRGSLEINNNMLSEQLDMAVSSQRNGVDVQSMNLLTEHNSGVEAVSQQRIAFLKIEDVMRRYRPRLFRFRSFTNINLSGEKSDGIFQQDLHVTENKLGKRKKVRSKPRVSYCECCDLQYSDFKQHMKSASHKLFAENSTNFATLDAVISSLELGSLKPTKCVIGRQSDTEDVIQQHGKVQSSDHSDHLMGNQSDQTYVTQQFGIKTAAVHVIDKPSKKSLHLGCRLVDCSDSSNCCSSEIQLMLSENVQDVSMEYVGDNQKSSVFTDSLRKITVTVADVDCNVCGSEDEGAVDDEGIVCDSVPAVVVQRRQNAIKVDFATDSNTESYSYLAPLDSTVCNLCEYEADEADQTETKRQNDRGWMYANSGDTDSDDFSADRDFFDNQSECKMNEASDTDETEEKVRSDRKKRSYLRSSDTDSHDSLADPDFVYNQSESEVSEASDTDKTEKKVHNDRKRSYVRSSDTDFFDNLSESEMNEAIDTDETEKKVRNDSKRSSVRSRNDADDSRDDLDLFVGNLAPSRSTNAEAKNMRAKKSRKSCYV